MLRRGASVFLAVGLSLLGSGPLTRSYAASNPVTFSTDWSVACEACQTPVVANGTIFTVARVGAMPSSTTVRTFDSATGAAGWTHPLGKLDTARVDAVGNGLVYLDETLRNGTVAIVALDAATGEHRWTVGPPRSGNGAQYVRGIEVDGTGAFVVNGTVKHLALSRFDPTGARLWTQEETEAAGGFALARGQVFLFGSEFVPPESQRDSLAVFREDTGRRVNKFLRLDPVAGPFVDAHYGHGLLYAVQYARGEGGGLGAVAFDPKTGAIAWQGSGTSAVAVGANVVVTASGDYSSSLDSELHGYDPTSGALRWGPIGETGFDPVIVGDTVYTTNGAPALTTNTLQAHDLASGARTGTFRFPKSDPPTGLAAAEGHLLVAGRAAIRSLTPHG